MRNFRFEGLEIWQDAIVLTDEIFEIADLIEARRKYKFSEQLFSAMLSVSNNIAEGSGSHSKKEFSHYLNISKRSCFEVANMIFICARRNYIDDETFNDIISKIDVLCRRIEKFKQSLFK